MPRLVEDHDVEADDVDPALELRRLRLTGDRQQEGDRGYASDGRT
jgi:hypothetical protein